MQSMAWTPRSDVKLAEECQALSLESCRCVEMLRAKGVQGLIRAPDEGFTYCQRSVAADNCSGHKRGSIC